jgi:hypothetical protein
MSAAFRIGRAGPAVKCQSLSESAAVTALPRFIATVQRDVSGLSAVIYRPVFEPADTAAVAEEAIEAMKQAHCGPTTPQTSPVMGSVLLQPDTVFDAIRHSRRLDVISGSGSKIEAPGRGGFGA